MGASFEFPTHCLSFYYTKQPVTYRSSYYQFHLVIMEVPFQDRNNVDFFGFLSCLVPNETGIF